MAANAQIVTLSYDDLVSFDPGTPDVAMMEQIGKAFGTTGLGILQVSGVPNFAAHRSALLPLAAKLPHLPDLDTCIDAASFYSVGWSHGKEELAPGMPDTAKGSYYANPLTEDLAAALAKRDGGTCSIRHRQDTAAAHPEFFAPNLWPSRSLPELQTAFTAMGQLLQTVGCLVAAVCDSYCLHQHGVRTGIATTIQRSLNAKGRLLHYFDQEGATTVTDEQPWCGWHNDHGSLTGLVPGMFLNAQGDQVPCPDARSGLYIQARTGERVRVSVPADHCAFQIGETSQITSGGLLRATPHAVLTGSAAAPSGITRESFAVFLEPEFDHRLDIPSGFTVDDCQGVVADDSLGLQPLKARWRPGQTFGDFHLATVSAFTTSEND